MSKRPSILQSLTPILILIGFISLNVILLGDDTLSGANQLSLLCASAIAAGIAICNRVKWDEILQGILSALNSAIPALLILLMIGVLAGTWMLSGIIPAMIYYGLYILHPDYFLPAVVMIASIISVATGSSWSTVATVGVALLGIGHTLGFKDALVTGAIISGAYFGDKISPLSDTTNLAAATVEIDLFRHIRYMLYTTVPAMLVTLVIFTILSLFGENGDGSASHDSVAEVQQAIARYYHITPWLFLVPIIVIIMIVRKMPAAPALFIGGIAGAIAALIFQGDVIAALSGKTTFSASGAYKILTQAMYGTTTSTTGHETLDALLTSHGMAGMLNTVWLIICAMIFGGVMEAGHFLERIAGALIKHVHSDGGLVATTAATCVLFNTTASDQYISIMVPGKMFTKTYQRNRLAPEVLSRTLEDAGTATSVLIPWNTCGATQAGVLGVATFAYLPYAFFCCLSPLISVLFARFNIRIRRIKDNEEPTCKDENENN